MFTFGIIPENYEVFDWKVLWIRGEGEWNSFGFLVCSAVSRSISWVRCLPVVSQGDSVFRKTGTFPRICR